MNRFTLSICLGLMLSLGAFAQNLSGFDSRFSLVKNEQGQVVAIKLKKVINTFTIKPFLDQIKNDLKREQAVAFTMTDAEQEAEIDQMLYDIGLDPYAKNGDGVEEAQRMKESLMNIKTIDVDQAFVKAGVDDFWKEFERRLKEALLFVDPTVMANLDDARFFYKRQIAYQVVAWALEEAKRRFSEIPILNIVSFVVVRVHDMMLEQRHFHHNMLLHYFETVSDYSKLGLTKEEVDRATSSIFEYRIEMAMSAESNRAVKTWQSYGWDKFYVQIRSGNATIRNWQDPLSTRKFTDIKKLNFGFASVTEKVKEGAARRIYHLHHSAHQFTRRPAMAFDYANPSRVKRNRALMNLAGVALGFIPNIPDFIKSNVQSFLQSMYVQQVRTEGGLVGYFETTGDTAMMRSIYAQRANFYIVE